MTYVAFGPLGPRIAVAVSRDSCRGNGSARCCSDTRRSGTSISTCTRTRTPVLPRADPGTDGEPSYAMLHRPMCEPTGWVGMPSTTHRIDERPGIWLSYVRSADVDADLGALAAAAGSSLRRGQ